MARAFARATPRLLTKASVEMALAPVGATIHKFRSYMALLQEARIAAACCSTFPTRSRTGNRLPYPLKQVTHFSFLRRSKCPPEPQILPEGPCSRSAPSAHSSLRVDPRPSPPGLLLNCRTAPQRQAAAWQVQSDVPSAARLMRSVLVQLT